MEDTNKSTLAEQTCSKNHDHTVHALTQVRVDRDRQSVEEWRMKTAQKNSSIKYKKTRKKKKGIEVEHEFWNSNLSEKDKGELYGASLYKMTGSTDPGYARTCLMGTMSAYALDKENIEVVNGTVNALMALEPKDEIEGMLISRLLVLHSHYTKYMIAATLPDMNHKILDFNLNRATKLMRVYNETLDALNKHRRKGKQQITVQHVHVNEGGQAVVGAEINTGGPGKNEGTGT